MRTFYRAIRTFAGVTLFFFCWTFLPLWQVAAYAAAPEARKEARNSSERGVRSLEPRTGERFEKALETIRENVAKAEEKESRNQDITAEVAEVKKQRTEIESIDSEFKKEFAATEKKLRDAGLPKEILDRHKKFVKHYDDNLKELKANLDGHDRAHKAHNKAQAGDYLKKTKLHLEKVKAPKRHKPLDPNNLPNRLVKGKERAPRLKKEEFEKDFKPQKRTKLAADERRLTQIEANWGDFILRARMNQKPILVASNGPLTGLLSSEKNLPLHSEGAGWGEGTIPQLNDPTSAFDLNTASPFHRVTASEPLLLAQAAPADVPTADDLAQTPEVQFTPEIQALAAQLNHNPVKISAWVRNNIEFVPTYGSIQGADMCLQSKQCNAFDTASLLIALLRTSNIAAHYAYGTIEVPIDKAMNWVGGFSEPTSALNFVASGGIPVIGQRSGGKIYAAQLEHVWVEAWIDYIPSRGAVHKVGDTWIPLDASYKQYTYTDGVDFQAVVPFNGQSLADQIKATATINEQEGYVTNVNSALIQTALNDYNAQLENYVNQHIPNATPGDILGKKEIVVSNMPILPASLPYKVIVAGAETSEIPDQLRHKVTIQLTDADNASSSVFTYTASLPQLAGKRLTVSYDPATAADQTTITKYAEQYATSIPAYLVQFKPVLKIEGATIATGASIGMGNAQDLTITITSPKSAEIVTHSLLAGDYTAIGLNPSIMLLNVFQNRVNKNDFSEPVGEMLHQTALSYWAEADAFNNVIAKALRVNILRHPSELAASAKVSVSYIWSVPSSATYNRRNIDVKFDNQTVFSKSSNKTKEFNYMQQSGITSSLLEGVIMDQLFGGHIGDSISAVTALKAANDQGIPIYKIDSSNITAILPKLQVADAIKTEISNAVNAGLAVQIPQVNITQSGWTGVGYIVSNSTDGTGAYRISGGLNGSDNNTGGNTVIPLPQVPFTGVAAFVIDGFTKNVGTITTTQTGTLIGIVVATGALLAAMSIMLLIWGLIKVIADKYQPPPRWETFRHFTSKKWVQVIIATQRLKVGEEEGMYGSGIYLTKEFIQPDSAENAFGYMSYGPNCHLILTTLELYSIDRTEGYIDFSIDTNKRGVFPKRPPEEYLLMGMPGEIMPFGSDIRVIDYWYPGVVQ